jgi:hypothetical protein
VIDQVCGVPMEEALLPSARETGQTWRRHDQYKG